MQAVGMVNDHTVNCFPDTRRYSAQVSASQILMSKSVKHSHVNLERPTHTAARRKAYAIGRQNHTSRFAWTDT